MDSQQKKKPLTPSSAFMQFQSDVIGRLREENSELSQMLLYRLIANQWNNLSPEEKLRYETDYQEKSRLYLDELSQYQSQQQPGDESAKSSKSRSQARKRDSQHKLPKFYYSTKKHST